MARQTNYFIALVNLDTQVAKIRSFTPQNREKFKQEIADNSDTTYSVYKLRGNTVDDVFEILKNEIGIADLTRDTSRDRTSMPACIAFEL